MIGRRTRAGCCEGGIRRALILGAYPFNKCISISQNVDLSRDSSRQGRAIWVGRQTRDLRI
jgi:hypothetical protein